MAKRFLVIGLGRFGCSLAETLSAAGAEVIAVDSDMQLVDSIKHTVTYAIALDGTDAQALSSIDSANCTSVFVTIGDNFEAAVLTVAALRDLGVKNIVARARTDRHRRILLAAGASEVVELETEMGRTVADRVMSGQAAAVIAAK